MDPYPILGVAADVSDADLRRAYLKLARRHHPDSHPAAGRAAAEKRMQEINAAWSLVGDPVARARYNRTSGKGTTASARTSAGFDGDRRAWMHDPDDEYWTTGTGAYHGDDTMITNAGTSGRGRPMALLPPALFVSAALLLIVGVVVQAGGVVAFALMLMVIAGLAFLVLPFVDMARSRRDDRG